MKNKNETTSQITESVQPILAAPDSCLLSEFQPLLEPASSGSGNWRVDERRAGGWRASLAPLNLGRMPHEPLASVWGETGALWQNG